MQFSLAELAWARPQALVLLLLPLVLLWFLRRKRVPEARPTGTLDLWLEIARDERRPMSGAARRIPPRAWCLLLALCLGSFAVAGPEFSQPPREVLWCFELDRSPSMYLPVEANAQRTRYDAALGLALDWLEEHGVQASKRRWRTPGSAIEQGAEPPPAWSAAQRPPAPELADSVVNRDGSSVIWNRITDAAPFHADGTWGYFASGGAAIPGPVGDHAGRSLVWDGDRIVPGDEIEPRTLFVDEGVPSECREFARIWASERGVRQTEDPAHADLSLLFRGTGVGEPVRAQGQGWSAEVSAHAWSAENRDGATSWLSAGERVLARRRPGRVELAFSEIADLGGDPAAFALAWGELLDACLPLGPGCVSLAERQSAGPEALVEPVPSAPAPAASSGRIQPPAWLALIATLLALAAFGPARRAGDGKASR